MLFCLQFLTYFLGKIIKKVHSKVKFKGLKFKNFLGEAPGPQIPPKTPSLESNYW